MVLQQLLPTDIGISGVDLTDVATTRYTSSVINMGDIHDIMVLHDLTASGGVQTGDAKLTVQRCDSAGVNWGPEEDFATGIQTSLNDLDAVYNAGVGSGITGIFLTAVGNSGAMFRVGGFMKITLEITTTSGASTATGDVRVLISKRKADSDAHP